MLKFFQDLVEAGRKHEDRPDFETRRTLVVNIFNTHGENLVSNLITAAIFILPQYMHHDVAETFYQVCIYLLNRGLSNLTTLEPDSGQEL